MKLEGQNFLLPFLNHTKLTLEQFCLHSQNGHPHYLREGGKEQQSKQCHLQCHGVGRSFWGQERKLHFSDYISSRIF